MVHTSVHLIVPGIFFQYIFFEQLFVRLFLTKSLILHFCPRPDK